MADVKYKCKTCNCLEYPDCVVKSRDDFESCDNCIDGASGFHKKVDNNGIGIADIPDWYQLCSKCDEYFEPEESHDC